MLVADLQPHAANEMKQFSSCINVWHQFYSFSVKTFVISGGVFHLFIDHTYDSILGAF